jgi:cytochrome c2
MRRVIPADRRSLIRLGLVLLLLMLAGIFQVSRAEDNDGAAGAKFSPEAATTFNKRCTACHTYGRGIKVGPDLKGVTERRKQDWLLKFIHASSNVIKSGDPIATALFSEYKKQRMPDWTDLSDKQIHDILDYIAIGGPDIKPADERNAQVATAAEMEMGRKLFYGDLQFRYGVQACVACHAVQGAGLRGGSLGPDLTSVYLRYQDIALTTFMRHPCFAWNQQTSDDHYLAPKEGFALKAFLRMAALRQSADKHGDGNTASNGKYEAIGSPPKAGGSR